MAVALLCEMNEARLTAHFPSAVEAGVLGEALLTLGARKLHLTAPRVDGVLDMAGHGVSGTSRIWNINVPVIDGRGEYAIGWGPCGSYDGSGTEYHETYVNSDLIVGGLSIGDMDGPQILVVRANELRALAGVSAIDLRGVTTPRGASGELRPIVHFVGGVIRADDVAAIDVEATNCLILENVTITCAGTYCMNTLGSSVAVELRGVSFTNKPPHPNVAFTGSGVLIHCDPDIPLNRIYYGYCRAHEFPGRTTLFHSNSNVLSGSALTRTIDTAQSFSHYASQGAGSSTDAWTQSTTLRAGTYTIRILGVAGPDRGQLTFTFNGIPVGGTFDLYQPSATNNFELSSSSFSWSSDGYIGIAGTVSGKNASSTGYRIPITTVEIRRTTD
jgi:hypothetical protein